MRFATCLLVLLGIAPALASAGTIDMTTALVDPMHGGKQFPDPNQAVLTPTGQQDCTKCGPLTLGMAIATAMCAGTQEHGASGGTPLQKAQDCSLGQRLIGDKAASLTAAQIKTIEDDMGIWSPAVGAQVIKLIDPNAMK